MDIRHGQTCSTPVIEGGLAFVLVHRRGFVEIGGVEAVREEFVASATSRECVGEDAWNEPAAGEIADYIVESFADDKDPTKN